MGIKIGKIKWTPLLIQSNQESAFVCTSDRLYGLLPPDLFKHDNIFKYEDEISIISYHFWSRVRKRIIIQNSSYCEEC